MVKRYRFRSTVFESQVHPHRLSLDRVYRHAFPHHVCEPCHRNRISTTIIVTCIYRHRLYCYLPQPLLLAGGLGLLLWTSLENLLCDGWLPLGLILAIDLGGNGEGFCLLQQAGADDNLGAQEGLMVIDVSGAIGAVVTVNWFA